MRTALRNARLVGLAALAAVGCGLSGSGNQAVGTGSNRVTGDGTIGLKLTLVGGAPINTVHFSIHGPNGTRTLVAEGAINIRMSTSTFFEIHNIAPGSGYSITASAADDGGDTCLAASAPFRVEGRAQTNVAVSLKCPVTGAPSGAALVSTNTSNCATWQSIATNPGESIIGSAAEVIFTATGRDRANLTFTTSMSGTGAGTVSPSSGFVDPVVGGAVAFNCTESGVVTLTLVFADGPLTDSGVCDPSLTTVAIPLQCDYAVINDGGVSTSPFDSQ